MLSRYVHQLFEQKEDAPYHQILFSFTRVIRPYFGAMCRNSQKDCLNAQNVQLSPEGRCMNCTLVLVDPRRARKWREDETYIVCRKTSLISSLFSLLVSPLFLLGRQKTFSCSAEQSEGRKDKGLAGFNTSFSVSMREGGRKEGRIQGTRWVLWQWRLSRKGE